MSKPLLVFLLAFLAVLGALALGRLNPAIARENGLLENAQIASALLAGLVFLWRARQGIGDGSAALWAGAFLGFTCMAREIDVDSFDAPPAWALVVGDGLGRDIVLGLLISGVIVFSLRAVLRMKTRLARLARTWFGVFMVSAAAYLLLGDLFEQVKLAGDQSQLFEEYLELVGYFMLLLAALTSRASLISVGLGARLAVEEKALAA